VDKLGGGEFWSVSVAKRKTRLRKEIVL